jgi:hypothetical protein
MANLHNVLSDLYVYMNFETENLLHTWSVVQTGEGTVGTLEFKLNASLFANFPLYVRRPLGRCRIQISALPDQNLFLEENTLFKGHDITRLMNWLVEHDIAVEP